MARRTASSAISPGAIPRPSAPIDGSTSKAGVSCASGRTSTATARSTAGIATPTSKRSAASRSAARVARWESPTTRTSPRTKTRSDPQGSRPRLGVSQGVEAKRAEVVVLGAGPAGLAAGVALARAGCSPWIVERDDTPGGLMRGLRHGAYQVDLGRKELYNRIPEVVRLWESLLGEDLRPYAHRVGILYDGVIIERERVYRGALRGLPPRMLARGARDFVRARVR